MLASTLQYNPAFSVVCKYLVSTHCDAFFHHRFQKFGHHSARQNSYKFLINLDFLVNRNVKVYCGQIVANFNFVYALNVESWSRDLGEI